MVVQEGHCCTRAVGRWGKGELKPTFCSIHQVSQRICPANIRSHFKQKFVVVWVWFVWFGLVFGGDLGPEESSVRCPHFSVV